jgi:hypothetical protein
MSISSVPGASSVFFASLPIDYLPIDKVWEKVRGFAAPVKSPNRIIVTILAMWRVIGDVPFISGHALFLTYAVATARRWVVFALSVFVLIETLYLKFVVWNDIATAAIGVGLGGALAVVYWWVALSFTHALSKTVDGRPVCG